MHYITLGLIFLTTAATASIGLMSPSKEFQTINSQPHFIDLLGNKSVFLINFLPEVVSE